jgi:hypothetical protein
MSVMWRFADSSRASGHFREAPILLKNSLLQPPHAADSLPLGLAGDLSDDRRAVGDAGEFVLPLSG